MTDGKKILVVYYSKTGNTERVGQDIASRLGADSEKIIDLKKRSGILGWILGGRDATRKLTTEIGQPVKDPAAYDIVVIGTPMWGWNMTPAVRAYVEKMKDKLKNVAFFGTSGGSSLDKTFSQLEELAGKKAVASVGFVAPELRDKTKYGEKMAAFIEAVKK